MVRSIAILLTIVFALYLLVHYAFQEPKPVAPKPAPLPPLMNVSASTELPPFCPTPVFATNGLTGSLPHSERAPVAAPGLEKQLYAALRKVARYRKFAKTAVQPAYLLKSQNERYFVVELGQDSNTKFAPMYTVRVWNSGRVDQKDREAWVPLISAQVATR